MIGNDLLPINIFLSTSVTNVKVAEETVKSEEKSILLSILLQCNGTIYQGSPH